MQTFNIQTSLNHTPNSNPVCIIWSYNMPKEAQLQIPSPFSELDPSKMMQLYIKHKPP